MSLQATASDEPRKRAAPKKVTIKDIAEAALEKADGEAIAAAAIMEQKIRADPKKYHALMDPLVASACFTAVSQVIHANREKVWTARNYKAGGNGHRVHALAAGNLLLFPLPGGKALGEATREEVSEAAVFYGKQAADMSLKSRWLARIAEKLAEDAIVAEVFTADALRALQAEMSNA